MRVQKQKTRKDKNYYKYVIVLPQEVIDKAEFKEGDDLEADARKGEIKLKKI